MSGTMAVAVAVAVPVVVVVVVELAAVAVVVRGVRPKRLVRLMESLLEVGSG
ncbi:hypothetical protein ABZZ47_01660 [Streptomyces sp. NPDC006465]|uniref:hypothetical protein n=1 Tax=Streptomyces sp. NPDC006465 TaxID=3157174 RepID=UPI0033B81CB0